MAKFLFSSLQKRLITSSATISPSLTTPPPLSAESAMSITKRDRAFQKRSSVLNLFRNYGFEDLQIQKLFGSRVFKLDARKLKPKIDCLAENGFTGELLHKLIVSSPYILLGSLDARIKPNFQVLKQYLDSDEKVVTVINRSKWFVTSNLKLYLAPNIEFLINEGVPVNRLSHLLLLEPRVLMQRRDRMVYAVKTVREFGVAPDDPMFIRCFRVVCGLTESKLKKKLELLKSFGWSDEQVIEIFKRWPSCFGISEETLKRKMSFYLNTLKMEPEIVICNPSFLVLSVDRVHARYEVLKILESKKLTRGMKGMKMPLASAVRLTEDQFLRNYVIKHVERVPGLLDMYCGILNRKKEQNGQLTEP